MMVGIGANFEFAGLDVGDSIEVAREQGPVVGILSCSQAHWQGANERPETLRTHREVRLNSA